MQAQAERLALIHQTLVTVSREIGPRTAGSRGQRQAEQHLAQFLRECGLEVEIQKTNCPRWELGAISLRLDGRNLPAVANPHTPPCLVTLPLVCLQSREQLRQAELSGRIAVLSGELTRKAFFPRNFDLFRDEAQDGIIAALEEKAPAAVILVRHQEAAVPLMEDAEFPLPSATVGPGVGQELLSAEGRLLHLEIAAERHESYAANIIARGPAGKAGRLLLCAHYDTKFYTPGALDNASGVAALLALARLLQSESALDGIELVLTGGEDSWFPAEMDLMNRNAQDFPDIRAAVNIDSVGAKQRRPSITFLECPEPLVEQVLAVKAAFPEIVQVNPWYDGDQSLFAARGIPSLALSSEGIHELIDKVVHTPLDRMEGVDIRQIDEVVRFVHALLPVLKGG